MDLHTLHTTLLALAGAPSARARMTARAGQACEPVSTFDDRRTDLAASPWPAERVLEGDPQVRNLAITCSADGALQSGLWECTAGRIEVVFDYGDEVIHILDGAVEITDEDGLTQTLGPGDVAHLRHGARTVWHVPVFVRKLWVTSDARTDVRSRVRRRLARRPR